MLTVGSLFSGIGGFDLGCERAGMRPLWQIELDDACRRVLGRHWDSVQRSEDVGRVHGAGSEPSGHVELRQAGRQQRHGAGAKRRVHGGCIARGAASDLLPDVDVVCGGFPCQDLSVAGKRAGLAGERSGLWFQFHRLLVELAPRWVVIENVPGLLSSNQGRDMAVILRGLAELGYGWAYRVLDAQYFGVAQRRRRVFIVGCLGDGSAAAQVLFEPESCDGDTPPSRAPREGLAGTLGGGSGERGWAPDTEHMTFIPSLGFHSTQDPISLEEMTALGTGNSKGYGSMAVASVAVRGREDGQEWELGDPEVGNALRAGDGGSSRANWLLAQMAVRRLTPTECERLQGFPDGWTEGESDSARYRMLGNAVAVPVVEWIARRIVHVNG